VLETARQAPAEMAPSLLDLVGRLGDNQAVEPLLAMLSAGNASTRAAAMRALGELLAHSTEEAPAAVVATLRPMLGEPDFMIQLAAAQALAIGVDDARGRNMLLEMAHAATAAAEGVLSGATADVPNALRLEAIRTLGRLKDAATRAVLLALLRDGDESVRGAACDALSHCGDARTVDVLRKVQMNDPDPAVKEKAKFAILDIRERLSPGAPVSAHDSADSPAPPSI